MSGKKDRVLIQPFELRRGCIDLTLTPKGSAQPKANISSQLAIRYRCQRCLIGADGGTKIAIVGEAVGLAKQLGGR